MVAFEAAVAGGIPIIKAMREGLSANRIEWIAGIINGTCNYILSEMRDKGLRLRRRARRGAAPGLRRGRSRLRHRGHRRRAQAHHPLGHRLRHPDAVRQGLHRGHRASSPRPTSSTPRSWATASSCWASRGARPTGIELRVHPTLIPARRLIANVEGVMNAVLVKGDAVGPHALLRPRRRARRPTASAVVADLVDVTRMAHRRPRAPRAAPRLPARPALRHADPADGGRRDRLLPAPARARPARRAGRRDAHLRRPSPSPSTPSSRRRRARARSRSTW